MPKLAELIRRAIRVSSSPMGFVPSTAKPPATMLLLAFATERWKQTVTDAVAAGADAVVLTNKPGDKEIAEAVEATGEHPCGLLVADTGTDQIDRLRSLGVDFFVLEPEAPASALLEEKATLLLHLRQEVNDVQLRALDALPVIALYVEREPGPITIWRHMELQRISGLSRKPLALRVQPDAKQQDLLALRSAGVVLVTVDMKERDAAGAVRSLRGIIDALPRRKSGRPDNLPHVSMPGRAAAAAEDDDDGDEDDDDE